MPSVSWYHMFCSVADPGGVKGSMYNKRVYTLECVLLKQNFYTPKLTKTMI